MSIRWKVQRGYDSGGFLPTGDVEMFAANRRIKINGVSCSSIRISRDLFEQIKKCFDEIDNK